MRVPFRVTLALTLILLSHLVIAQTPMGTAFTYQGRLIDGGSAPTAAYDFRFRLYNASSFGSQIGSTATRDDLVVTAGIFATTMDFGAAFDGSAFWLETDVRLGASSGGYTTLTPRQQLMPTPMSLYSSNAATINGLSCGSNQVAKWIGTGWTCGADMNSGGTVTLLGTGSGLTGGPISSTGTISVATGGITASMIADGAIGSSKIDTSQVQTRIAGNCVSGAAVQSISADGTVTCTASSVPQGFVITTLDNSSSFPFGTSITIGADGLGLISYHDGNSQDLRVAHCDNTLCSSATKNTIDSAGDSGRSSSITIGTDGLGIIAYHQCATCVLRVAHCNNAVCSSATSTTIDTGGYSPSIIIGTDGLALIAYPDGSSLFGTLKVAHCENVACTAATINPLGTGTNPSITIGSDGLGLISCNDNTDSTVKVKHCDNVACSTANTYTIDTVGLANGSSITLGADGLGLISYWHFPGLYVAHCADVSCSTSVKTPLDMGGNAGRLNSITLGPDGLGLISYHVENDFDLKVAHCFNTTCSSAALATVDTFGGEYTSVTIGIDNLPVISYHGFAAGMYTLKVAHCSNVFCQPYVRRR